MRVGVTVPISASDGPGRVPTWPEMLRFASHAEAGGLDSVWVCDHFFSDDPDRPDDPPEGIHEAWTVLTALAATTEEVELGQLVMCASFRNPGLLAKMAATADMVSGGRLILGVGAGWYDPEYEAFGYPADHKVSRFDEALQILAPLLRGQRVTFEGEYHRAREATLLPPPDRRIPLLIAAERPRMLGLTARHADAWCTAWYGGPDDRVRRRLAEMSKALEVEARDPATLRRAVGVEVGKVDGADGVGILDGSVGELTRAFDGYAELGFNDVIVGLRPSTPQMLDRLSEAKRLHGR